MAEMNARRMGEFLRMLVVFLWERPGGAGSREIMEKIAASAHLAPQEAEPVPGVGGLPRFALEVRSAMTALEKAGWLARQGERWLLTGEGRLACRDFRDATEFHLEAQRLLENSRQSRPSALLALEVARSMAWEAIRLHLGSLPHHEFRSLVHHLLVAMGLQVEWTAPLDRRHGQVDLVACLDPLGPNRRYWVVHLRHSGQALDIRDLEALVSGAHPANRVLCVSTAGFSEAAREYALTRVPDRLALVDLETFVDLWIGHYGQLSAEARSAFPLEAVHFLAWGD